MEDLSQYLDSTKIHLLPPSLLLQRLDFVVEHCAKNNFQLLVDYFTTHPSLNIFEHKIIGNSNATYQQMVAAFPASLLLHHALTAHNLLAKHIEVLHHSISKSSATSSCLRHLLFNLSVELHLCHSKQLQAASSKLIAWFELLDFALSLSTDLEDYQLVFLESIFPSLFNYESESDVNFILVTCSQCKCWIGRRFFH